MPTNFPVLQTGSLCLFGDQLGGGADPTWPPLKWNKKGIYAQCFEEEEKKSIFTSLQIKSTTFNNKSLVNDWNQRAKAAKFPRMSVGKKSFLWQTPNKKCQILFYWIFGWLKLNSRSHSTHWDTKRKKTPIQKSKQLSLKIEDNPNRIVF